MAQEIHTRNLSLHNVGEGGVHGGQLLVAVAAGAAAATSVAAAATSTAPPPTQPPRSPPLRHPFVRGGSVDAAPSCSAESHNPSLSGVCGPAKMVSGLGATGLVSDSLIRNQCENQSAVITHVLQSDWAATSLGMAPP